MWTLISNLCTALERRSVGTKVTDNEKFMLAFRTAVEKHDFASERVPGQGFIMCPEAVPYVSAGVGHHTHNPDDYVVRTHREEAQLFLRREKAAAVEGCALIVYTREAYLADPDIQGEAQFAEWKRVSDSGCTHVLVGVLAFAGPKAPLSPHRLVANLAGGNREAEVWGVDEIRAKAAESADYWREWCVVAD